MKKYSMAASAAVVTMAFAGGVACAEETPAAEAAAPTGPTLTDVLTSSGLTATGYVAASYYHSNGYNTYHQFDVQHDTFQLDQAAATIAYQPKEGFGGLVNIAAGEDMKILNTAEGSNSNTFDVMQAYAQYIGGPVTVIAGKFVTLAGAEVIAPIGNTNFSRSLLFYAEPLTHTGVRATYAVSDTLSVIAGVNNGWNTVSTSYGSKTGEFGLAYTPNKMFAVTAQGYIGKAQYYPGTVLPLDAERKFFDFVGTYNATDALSFVLNYDWGQQDQSGFGLTALKWSGVAAYANYTFSDQWRVSVRGEYLDDKDGFVTGYDQKLKEGTVTLGYDPTKHFELRLEARYDRSGKATFVRANTTEGAYYTDSQTGFAVQGVLKF